jgi:hypothetical protein
MSKSLLNDMFFKIIYEFEVDLYELILLKGEICEQQIKILYEIAEHGYFGLLLNQVDGLNDKPFFELHVCRAFIKERKT